MSQPTPPQGKANAREFWIETRLSCHAEKPVPEAMWRYTHVIEASYAKELEAEVERLKGEFSTVLSVNDMLSQDALVHVIEASYAKELEAELALAVEALRFYANQNNWGMIHNEPTEDGGEEDIGARIDYDDVCRDEHDNNFMCAGEKARATLAMIEQGEK